MSDALSAYNINEGVLRMPNLIIDLVVDRVDLVDEGANSAAFIELYKRKEFEPTMTLEELLAKMKPENAAVVQETINKAKAEVPEDIAKQIADLQQEIADLQKAKPAVSTPEPDMEEVMKGLDPKVQAMFKSLQAQKDAAEEVARQAAENTANEAALAKARELKAIPVEEAKLVDILKGVSDEVFELLKSASAAIEASPQLEELGKGKGDTVVSNDAWNTIEKKAEELAKTEDITKQKAIGQVIKDNPELYKEYLKGGAN